MKKTIAFLIFSLLMGACSSSSQTDDNNTNSENPTTGDSDDDPIVETNTLTIPTSGFSTPMNYDGMTLIWNDEFDGDSLDETYWNFQIGDGCPNLCGWGNNELEYYTQENTTLTEGVLVIEAKKESLGGRSYTSSRINTQGKFVFKYGRVDVRANLPFGQGTWPAIWMLGENISTVGWPFCGEIDIMEMIGGQNRENTVHGTTHWQGPAAYASYGGSHSLTGTTFNDGFHVFSITWDEEYIRWFVDDVQYHEILITPDDLTEFHEEFHLLINLAIGGNWPGSPDATTVFPQFLIVDYVRVFQEDQNE